MVRLPFVQIMLLAMRYFENLLYWFSKVCDSVCIYRSSEFNVHFNIS